MKEHVRFHGGVPWEEASQTTLTAPIAPGTISLENVRTCIPDEACRDPMTNSAATPWIVCSLVLCSLTAASAAHGQVYKWVDEKGVVNYGSEPPKRAAAKALPPEASTVTIISGPASAPKADARDRELERRLARAEQELEDEKRSRAIAAQTRSDAEAARLARLREACERERRVDCDSDPYGARYDTVVVVPQSRYPYRPQARPPLNPVTVTPGAPRSLRAEKPRSTAGTHVRDTETRSTSAR